MSSMKERLDESFKKQNARRQGALDYCSFFEGYSAGLQERDIVLNKLNIAKTMIKELLDLELESEIKKHAEQFLAEE